MDAVMYLKEKTRMCETDGCAKCPLSSNNNGKNAICRLFEKYHAEAAVEIVEKWSKEHSRKTYLSDLLENYPKAQLEDGGYPTAICPHTLGYIEEVKCCGDCKECWNTPMEG